MCKCPICGGVMPNVLKHVVFMDGVNTVYLDGEAVTMPHQEWLILTGVTAKYPDVLRYQEIEGLFWGDDIDGGPLHSRRVIGVMLCRLRRKLRGRSVEIVTQFGVGLRLRIKQEQVLAA